jgi:hypothetical protein
MTFPNFCTLPESLVETLLVPYPRVLQKKAEKELKETFKAVAKVGVEVALSSAVMLGVKGIAQAVQAPKALHPSFEGLIQDYVDFYHMLKENPEDTLIEFGKFLKDSFEKNVSQIDDNSLIDGFSLYLGVSPLLPLGLLGPALYLSDSWMCNGVLDTFSVFPEAPGCQDSLPSVDISKEDVKDFLIDAAELAVPILGLL